MKRHFVEELKAQLEDHDNVIVWTRKYGEADVIDVSYDPDNDRIVIEIEA